MQNFACCIKIRALFQMYKLYSSNPKPMTQLAIPYDPYFLSIEFQNSSLHIQLLPTQSSSEPSFIYVSKLFPQNMGDLLKLLFNNSIQNIWTYLNFHKQKALAIDMMRIQEDNKQLAKGNQRNPEGVYDKKEVDLPISLKLIMLEGIGTMVKLKGDMTLESAEKRLAKSNEEIKRLKDQVQHLKEQIIANQAKLSLLHHLEEENSELKSRLENLERERFRSADQYLPRKRTHVSEDHELEQKKGKYSNPSSNIGQISRTIETSQQAKTPQLTKEALHTPEENSSSQSNSSGPNDKVDSMASNSSSKKSRKFQRNKVPSEQSKIVEQKPQLTNDNQNEAKDHIDRSFDEDQFGMNSYNMVRDNSFGKKPSMSSHREKLQECDQAKLIQNFSQKCLTEVGYSDKGEVKMGYVCVFCEKIFKQTDFLKKHIFSRHPEVLQSHVNEIYLMGKLNSYKMDRDLAVQAQIRNKKIEKLKSGFIDNKEVR